MLGTTRQGANARTSDVTSAPQLGETPGLAAKAGQILGLKNQRDEFPFDQVLLPDRLSQSVEGQEKP